MPFSLAHWHWQRPIQARPSGSPPPGGPGSRLDGCPSETLILRKHGFQVAFISGHFQSFPAIPVDLLGTSALYTDWSRLACSYLAHHILHAHNTPSPPPHSTSTTVLPHSHHRHRHLVTLPSCCLRRHSLVTKYGVLYFSASRYFTPLLTFEPCRYSYRYHSHIFPFDRRCLKPQPNRRDYSVLQHRPLPLSPYLRLDSTSLHRTHDFCAGCKVCCCSSLMASIRKSNLSSTADSSTSSTT